MFVCHYERKKFVDDHRQKYVEITKICLGIEIADKRLRFLQTKHLQCAYRVKNYELLHIHMMTCEYGSCTCAL